MIVEQKLKDLGLTLPQPTKPGGNYVTAMKTGNLLFVSGHGTFNDGKAKTVGKLGRELTVEDGYYAAKSAALNCLATVQAAIGDLDNIKKFVKVVGFVNCTEEFREPHKVMNGCSDLLAALFGEAGKHARSAIGMQALPNQVPVSVEMVIEIK